MIKADLKHKIDGLNAKAKKLFLLKLDQALQAESAQITNSGGQRLVAYVQGSDVETDTLKKHLRMNLPEYMVPSSIVLLDDFPMLPNGKVDRKKLMNIEGIQAQKKSIVTSKNNTETEQTLTQIWEEVLGFSPIDVNDNFFEIGGDSILSIQIIAKARKAGIVLEANEIFDHQTISELSLFAKEPISEDSQNEIVEGKVLLTPIQQRFFDTNRNAPNFWNQIVQVSGLENVENKVIKDIIEHLVDYHDALRLRFYKVENQWEAKILKAGQKEVFHYENIGSITEEVEQNKYIVEKLISLQRKVELSKGNLFQGAYFNCGPTQVNKFMMFAHHLVIDMISWNLLFGDFAQAVEQVKSNEVISFEKKTASVKQWGESTRSLAESSAILDEVSFWQEQCIEEEPFPTDFKMAGSVYQESTIEVYQNVISLESIGDLFNTINETYNTRTEDLLVAALLKTFTEWTNSGNLLLGLEHNGRSSANLDIDVSNTVGWFTSFFPILLEKGVGIDLGDLLVSVKEKLRSIPNNGVGFGLLKYSSGKDFFKSSDGEPQVIFNYLGVQNQSSINSKLIFEYLWEGSRDPVSERTYGLEINASVNNAKLHINWSYSTDLYKESTLKGLVSNFEKNLQELLDHCLQKEGNYSPSDFPEADLSQDDLDNLMKQFD